ncbi:MAG: hypothetical protein L6R30_01970 [Thermoanaerobaculia bacterium]|nr:hypothetical protein [Thermoanaerobaculia bacterium]
MSVTSDPHRFFTRRLVGAVAATVLLAGALASSPARAIPPAERTALIDLYTNTNGAGWATQTGWDTQTPGTECTWFGVCCWDGATCSGGTNVTSLNLNANGLSGTLPSTIGDLTAIQYLRLNSNALTGSLPASISNLSALIEFEAAGNSLSGSIPSGIGGKPSLQLLVLSGNQFSGSIPPEIWGLTNLQILALAANQLTGTIDAGVGNLTNLQELYLRYNFLSGPIPTEIGNLTSLQFLSLDGNSLVSPIPTSMTNLTALVAGGLDISFNALDTTDGPLIAFLNSKQYGGDWQSTQTIPPPGLATSNPTDTTIDLSWTSIPFNGSSGYYEIQSSTTMGGPYSYVGQTADKLATGIVVSGLNPVTTYYFVVRTVTDPLGPPFNPGTVTSEFTAEVSGTTLSSCTYALIPASSSPPAGGGTGLTFQVSTLPGCPWSAATNDSWIQVTGGTPGVGTGTVTYDVDPNTGPARQGFIDAGGEIFTVNQAEGCTANSSFVPTSANPPASGATGLGFSLSTDGACSWELVPSDLWITITSGLSGSGPAAVSFDVAANPGPARVGTITALGQTFTINQDDGCASNTTLNPTSATPPAAGAAGQTFDVLTPGACPWTAVANDPWLHITGGASGLGNGTVTYSVDANVGPLRVGTITAGGQTFTVTQADGCAFSLVPASANPPATGATGLTFQVQTGAGCPWTAVSNDAWLTLTGGASGNGPGTVTYDVAANPGPQRVGTLTAGGQTFTVTQADGCNASTTLFPTSANPPASGATGLTFQVQTTAGCSWTAVSNAAWITITAGSAGTGNGTVTYDVAANPSPARVGTITAGGQAFTVNQADGCAANTSLVPSSANHPASGASSQAFQIQTGAGCPWTAVSNASWITLTSSGSGSGPASVVYNIAANPGPARNGTVTAAGLTFTVNQADGCTLNTTLLPTGASQPAAGATGQGFQVQAAVGCSWTAVSNAAWITITAGAAGSGPGGVTYDVAANSGPARNGTITAGGQTFTVTQADGCLANTTLAPTSASPPSAGATGSTFQVQTAAGCAWTAVSNAAWITITAGSSGTGPGTVTYNVAANVGPDRTGTLTAAGKTFTVTQTDGCNANSTLTPASSSPPAEGAAGLAFQVQTAPSCAWTAVSNVAWITITAGASGTGPGTVAYSVAANAGPARTGTITAAGQTFTVNQPNTCTSGTVLSPGSATIPAAGATGQSFQIQTFAACPWTAVSNAPWISITSATAGTGPGTITFDVASNPGLGRTGTITAAGQTFSVIQGEGCQAGAALTPASSSAPAAGATGQVLNLSIAEGCPWTASALDPWITLTSETSGTGNATLRFSVDRNTGRERSGRISAAGLFHTVNQEDGCAEGTTLSSPGASVPAAGAVGQSFSIAASPDCSWTAVSNAAWISILSGTPGSGAGTIVYSVAANAGPERSGTITAGGKTFTITQADSCTAGTTLNPSSASVPVAGASGLTFQVATSAACPWTAVAEDSWITITAGASGTGNGTVTFSVAPNDGPDRTGTITVAGTAFTINQAPGCFTPAVPRISSHPVAPVLAGNSFTVAWDPVLDLPSTGFYRLHIANNAACASPVSNSTTGLSVTVPTEPGKVVTYCIQIQSVAGGICPPANTSPLSEPVLVEVRPLPASFTVIQGQLPAARTNVNGPPPSGSTVVFRNIGESAGTLTLSATGGFFSIARQNVLEVAAGTDLEVGLLFTTANTTVEGIQNGELTGTWSVAGEALSVSTPITLTVLAGSSQPTGGMKLEPVGSATITFSLPAEPATVRFGQNGVNPAPQDVLVRNTGSLPVRISPTIGPGGTWLSISGDFTTPIPAYTERTFTLSVDRSRRTSEEGAPPLSTILRIENVDGNPDDAAVFEVIDEEPPPPVSGTNRAELLDTEYSLIVGSSVSTSSSPAGGKSWLFGAPENTQYQSDGWIRNRSSDQISVDLYYTPDSAQGLTDPGVKKNTVTLDGYRSYRLSDFVKSLFAENGSGLVEVRSRQLPQLSIRQIVDSVTIRNGIPYNNGAEFPLVVSGEGVSAQGSAGTGDRIILSGMKGPKAGFRTNLIFSETIGKPVAVRARLYGTDGRKLAEKKVAINPYSKTQVNGGDPELFPIPYDNATVVVEPLSGEGFVSVVATVIDNASGSYFIRLGTVSARPAQATRTSKAVTSGFLPVVSREESPDTFYTTRLSVTNASESDATINVTFLPEKGYGVPSEPVTVVVPKKESGEGEDGPKSVTFGNVLEELLGIQSNARGMLKIEGELESLVFATETSTPLDKTDPEAGRSLSSFNLAPGSDAKFAGAFSINSPEVTGIRQTESDTAKAEVSVPAIEEGSQYRTNLILAELAGEKGKVKVILRKPGGAALGEPLVVELAPFERKQIDRVITTIVKPPSGTGEYKDIEIIVQALEGKAKSIALVSRVASDPKSRRLDTYVLGPSTSGSAKKAKK